MARRRLCLWCGQPRRRCASEGCDVVHLAGGCDGRGWTLWLVDFVDWGDGGPTYVGAPEHAPMCIACGQELVRRASAALIVTEPAAPEEFYALRCA